MSSEMVHPSKAVLDKFLAHIDKKIEKGIEETIKQFNERLKQLEIKINQRQVPGTPTAPQTRAQPAPKEAKKQNRKKAKKTEAVPVAPDTVKVVEAMECETSKTTEEPQMPASSGSDDEFEVVQNKKRVLTPKKCLKGLKKPCKRGRPRGKKNKFHRSFSTPRR